MSMKSMRSVEIPNMHPETNHHRNLATEITSLYGREVWQYIRLLEKLRVKIQRRAADLTFLKDCRDMKLTPTFAVINHCMRSKWNARAFDKLSTSLVKTEIRKTRFKLDRLSQDALKLHLELAATVNFDLWKAADANAALKADREGRETRTKHQKKLTNLQKKTNTLPEPEPANCRKVVNLS